MQTLLFSATVTKSLRDLARLRLSNTAEFIQIHDFDEIEGRLNRKTGAEEGGDEADA